MRIVLAGGSGFLGSALRRRLAADGHEVVTLSRRPRGQGDVAWNPDRGDGPAAARRSSDWVHTIDGAGAVINLAGESIAGKRWSPARKAALRDSRIRSTRAIVGAITAAQRPPSVLINGSAIGIYGPHGDEPVTEDTLPGADFLSALAVEWEAEARAAEARTRVVLLRTGLVLDSSGGALPQMALPFKLMAGGPVGSGNQYLSWIHVDDWVEMVAWALRTAAVTGPLNATAPEPVTNREFAKTLGRVLGRPAFMPAPGFALKLLLGEMADALLLTGQRVLPRKAQALGFTFRYPRLEEALRAIYRIAGAVAR
jgi:uncharacterized protein (TIGR01777 family)